MKKIERTEEEWRSMLTPDEYRILREHGTERAFTGAYLDEKRAGVYRCRGCKTELFDAATKYESGSGWPSFYDALDEAKVKRIEDRSFGMVRVEIRCAACDGHLGHVFPDGPRPTGERYCVNSLSLDFEPEEG